MLDRIEALRALRDTGTMGLAAARLRVTASAVSKRVAALEEEVGTELVVPEGRRVRLTAEGERLLAEAEPLLLRLREVLRAQAVEPTQARVAATDSLLASWLPSALRESLLEIPGLSLELHAHRGPVLIERVRAGDYALGIGPEPQGEPDLGVVKLGEEPMAIVPASLVPIPRDAEVVPVFTIEERSLTWEGLVPRLRRAVWGFRVEVVGRMESFAALVQVAKAGFANALVPVGVARGLGVPEDRLVILPGLSRSIAAFGRPRALERPEFRALMAGLARRLTAPSARRGPAWESDTL